ncbi:MAG: DUF4252 domain-containing protein [Saprospiraceae bacterium]
MKKILIAIAILSIPLLATSQHESIENFYNKYVDNEKISDISLNGWILSMASKMSEEDGTEILQKITKLRIMLAEEKDIVSKADVKKLMRDVRNNDFEDLMTIRDEGTRVNFMIREKGKNITNVLVIIHGEGDFILLSLEGNLNFEDLKQLDFDVEGGDIFKKLPDDRA